MSLLSIERCTALAVVGAALWAVTGRSDDMDEIRKLEALTFEGMALERSAPQGVEAATTDWTSDGGGTAEAPIAFGDDTRTELQRAQAEIERLQRELAEQERRHRAELIRSNYNMGCVYRAAKRYRQAEEEFLKVLDVDPDDAGTHYNLGVLYDDDLHEPAKARIHYERFLELAPGDRDAPMVREWLSGLE
jgi:tetratricopeptide (TPR) repeat protein